jgi:hypothetical protein
MSLERVTVPDFGGVQKITVIEVLVTPATPWSRRLP